MTRTLTADRGDAGQRLDLVVCRHLGGDAGSRTRVQAWIEDGRVTVNGVAVRRTSARAAAGDVITVAATTPARRRMAAEPAPLGVLYEDEHLLALDKPAGIVVHPTYRHEQGTLMNALLFHAATWPAGFRPSIVGRLDKLTSGLVVVAKSPAVHAALQRILASPRSSKEYLALVYGRVKQARGQIELPLARDPRDRRRVVAASGGLPSRTQFERLGSVPAPKVGLSLLRCTLATGRMHQIRVHLAERGWPILGDPKYGRPRWPEIVDAELARLVRAFPRQALHAWQVRFTHPVSGRTLAIESPIPPDLSELLAAAGLSAGNM